MHRTVENEKSIIFSSLNIYASVEFSRNEKNAILKIASHLRDDADLINVLKAQNRISALNIWGNYDVEAKCVDEL